MKIKTKDKKEQEELRRMDKRSRIDQKE